MLHTKKFSTRPLLDTFPPPHTSVWKLESSSRKLSHHARRTCNANRVLDRAESVLPIAPALQEIPIGSLLMSLGLINCTGCYCSLPWRSHVISSGSSWLKNSSSGLLRYIALKNCRRLPRTVTTRMAAESGTERPDGSWVSAGMLLTAGGLLPSLLTCFQAEQVSRMF